MNTLTDSHPRVGSSTPWGPVQTAQNVPGLPGAVAVTTAGHGGWWLPAELRDDPRLPERWRGREWFEEDVEWAIPAFFLGATRPDGFGECAIDWLDEVRNTLARFFAELVYSPAYLVARYRAEVNRARELDASGAHPAERCAAWQFASEYASDCAAAYYGTQDAGDFKAEAIEHAEAARSALKGA